ncbi:MAG: sulfatase [Acidobacteria bacterium]|nr:sulfatase [Acidobacteriota bacterium]
MATLTRRAAFGLLAGPLAGQKQDRPNLILVFVDDLRWDALSSTGHAFAKTPHIDRIAREGMTFTNAFVTTPLCSPSRATFLSGQYVQTHGVTGNTPAGTPISHKLITYPMLLQKGGYETAYVGKIHMGMDASPRPGFDRWVSFRGQGVYIDPPMNIDGNDVARKGYMTDLLNDEAVAFLEKPRTKPFCLTVAHKAVHGPFTPADRHKNLYNEAAITVAPNASDDLKSKPAMKDLKPGGGSNDELIKNQLRCLAAIDEGIGRMFAALEKSRQLDNTVFVFSSDNGYFWREHGLGDKRWAFEESIRIPMLVRYPRLIKAGSKAAGIVANIDIAPTFTDLGGVPAAPSFQGKSFAPLFKNPKGRIRREFFCEYFKEANFPRTPSWRAIRTSRYKYVHYPELTGADEFYDLQKDPGEMKNIVSDPRANAFRERLVKPGVPV